MIPVMCVIQEGQISEDVEQGLKSALNDFTMQAFGNQADIDWIEVVKGNGFTAAQPSTSIITSLHANRFLEQSERLSLLKQLSEICMKETGRSANEVVTSIRDPNLQ